MKAIVTGAAGQLGRALVAMAPERVAVTALTRAQLDLSDTTGLGIRIAAEAPDLILNAAAYTAVDRAESDSATAYTINCDAAAVLAAAAARRGARLVHVSTDFVFDGCAGRPYAPEAPTAPLGVYGASKLAGEKAVIGTLPAALVVRTAWVYSAEGTNFLRTMLRLMAERTEINVVADQVGTPTHADSLARAIWELVLGGAGGIHHFTDAGVASWYDFAVAIQEEAMVLGLLQRQVPIWPIRAQDYPTPARRPSYSVLDKTETYAALGKPARHWRDELRAALRKVREMKDEQTNG